MSLDFEKVRRSLLREDAGAKESANFSLRTLLEAPGDEDEDEAGDEEDDEPLFDDEDEGEDEEGGTGGTGEGAEGDDTATSAEEEDAAEEEEEEEIEKVTPSETMELGKSVDDALQGVFVDYETKARKSAQLQKESRYSLRRYLLEATDIDLDIFTADIARLVMNYDNLLDMEAIIINKAIQFLTSNYNEEAAEEFLELLDIKHDVSLGKEEETPEHLAVGASGGGAGGAL
tara:strand:- start:7206 stop:7898 length:693 start_codon:yes stop_codon:yes gene_type:complete